MAKAILSKQVTISVDNQRGTLAEVTREFASYKINLIAIAVYTISDKCVVTFVSENNKHAIRLLKEKDYKVMEEDCVLCSVSNEPGALQRVTDKIADAGIDLRLIYGSVEKSGTTSRIVMVADNSKAMLKVIKGIA